MTHELSNVTKTKKSRIFRSGFAIAISKTGKKVLRNFVREKFPIYRHSSTRRQAEVEGKKLVSSTQSVYSFANTVTPRSRAKRRCDKSETGSASFDANVVRVSRIKVVRFYWVVRRFVLPVENSMARFTRAWKLFRKKSPNLVDLKTFSRGEKWGSVGGEMI